MILLTCESLTFRTIMERDSLIDFILDFQIALKASSIYSPFIRTGPPASSDPLLNIGISVQDFLDRAIKCCQFSNLVMMVQSSQIHARRIIERVYCDHVSWIE